MPLIKNLRHSQPQVYEGYYDLCGRFLLTKSAAAKPADKAARFISSVPLGARAATAWMIACRETIPVKPTSTPRATTFAVMLFPLLSCARRVMGTLIARLDGTRPTLS